MKNSNKNPFIFTSYDNVAEILKNNGFTPMQSANGQYMFLNDGKLTFTEEENKEIVTKMAYTNVLCI